MPLFKQLPKIEYGNKGNSYLLTDISKRISLIKSIKNNNSIYQDYNITGYEKAEHLAYDFYGSSDYVWLIYLMNDIIDPFYGWILSDNVLAKFITNKYGSGNENVINHYLLDGIVLDYNAALSTPITNTEHETRINEYKRTIKIIRPNFVNQILGELKNIL